MAPQKKGFLSLTDTMILLPSVQYKLSALVKQDIYNELSPHFHKKVFMIIV